MTFQLTFTFILKQVLCQIQKRWVNLELPLKDKNKKISVDLTNETVC